MKSTFKIFILSTLLLVSVSAFSQTFNGSYCNDAAKIQFYSSGRCVILVYDGQRRGEGTYTLSSVGSRSGAYNHITIEWRNTGNTQEGTFSGTNRETGLPSSTRGDLQLENIIYHANECN